MNKKTWALVLFVISALLITGGIIAKRTFGHTEWVAPLHLSASFFLLGSFGLLWR